MDNKVFGLSLVIIGVLVLTSAQLLIKGRLAEHGAIPFSPGAFLPYLWGVMGDWRMWLGLAGLVVASFLWYAAISRIPLSLAYPFGALSYPLVFAGSLLILKEQFSWQGLAGNLLIVAGVVLVASGARA